MSATNGKTAPDVDSGVEIFAAALAESRRRTAAAGPPPRPGVRLDDNIASTKASEAVAAAAREKARAEREAMYRVDEWTCATCGKMFTVKAFKTTAPTPQTICPACLGRRAAVGAWIGLANLPARFAHITGWASIEAFGNAAQLRVMRAIQAFAADRDASILIIIGPRGVGKTSLLVAAIREYLWSIPNGTPYLPPARYARAWDLCDDIRRESFGDVRNSETVTIVERTGLLVIDEAGNRAPSAWSDGAITNAIDERHNALLKTIIAGNVAKAELAAALSPSILDRANEGTAGGIVELTGESLRGRTKGGDIENKGLTCGFRA